MVTSSNANALVRKLETKLLNKQTLFNENSIALFVQILRFTSKIGRNTM